MNACTHACTHAHMHACMHTCTHAHMHACTHAHMHACTVQGYEGTHARVQPWRGLHSKLWTRKFPKTKLIVQEVGESGYRRDWGWEGRPQDMGQMGGGGSRG